MNRKMLLMVFLLGLLLVALGGGVAIAQYSQFDYVGEQVVGAEDLTTVQLQAQLQKKGQIIVDTFYYTQTEVVADENVAADAVCFDVSVNGDTAYVHKSYLASEENDAFCFSWTGYSGDEDVETLLLMRDELLADIKAHEFGTYRVAGLEKVVVRVHPDNVHRVLFY